MFFFSTARPDRYLAGLFFVLMNPRESNLFDLKKYLLLKQDQTKEKLFYYYEIELK